MGNIRLLVCDIYDAERRILDSSQFACQRFRQGSDQVRALVCRDREHHGIAGKAAPFSLSLHVDREAGFSPVRFCLNSFCLCIQQDILSADRSGERAWKTMQPVPKRTQIARGPLSFGLSAGLYKPLENASVVLFELHQAGKYRLDTQTIGISSVNTGQERGYEIP